MSPCPGFGQLRGDTPAPVQAQDWGRWQPPPPMAWRARPSPCSHRPCLVPKDVSVCRVGVLFCLPVRFQCDQPVTHSPKPSAWHLRADNVGPVPKDSAEAINDRVCFGGHPPTKLSSLWMPEIPPAILHSFGGNCCLISVPLFHYKPLGIHNIPESG